MANTMTTEDGFRAQECTEGSVSWIIITDPKGAEHRVPAPRLNAIASSPVSPLHHAIAYVRRKTMEGLTRESL